MPGMRWRMEIMNGPVLLRCRQREKAVKAVYQKLGADAWGHSVSTLLSNLPAQIYPEEVLIDKAKELDTHYSPSRYPNSYPSGAPLDFCPLGFR